MQITRIMLIGILLMLAACGTPAPTTPVPPEPITPTTPPITPPTAPTTVQGPYEVWVDTWEFRPSILTVPVGTKVTWTNKAGEQHTVTSATGLFDVSLSFGDSFSYTFTERGTFEYYCDIHAGLMGAKVIVE